MVCTVPDGPGPPLLLITSRQIESWSVSRWQAVSARGWQPESGSGGQRVCLVVAGREFIVMNHARVVVGFFLLLFFLSGTRGLSCAGAAAVENRVSC